MKKFFKALMAVALVGCAMPASAQFTGGKSGSSSSSADTESYNRISLSYDNTHFGCNKHAEGYFNDEDGMSLNGVGLEYTHGFSISQSLPMFIEAGIKAQFGAGSVSDDFREDGYKVEAIEKYRMFSFSVPVNYTYKFAIGDGMSIAPFLGINFKVNALGQYRNEIKFDDDDLQDIWEDTDEYEDMKDWYNLYSKDDMGDKDATWNRFQMGWQIGVGFNYKAFYVGLQYGTDFIPAWKYKKYAINTGNFALKVGYNF